MMDYIKLDGIEYPVSSWEDGSKAMGTREIPHKRLIGHYAYNAYLAIYDENYNGLWKPIFTILYPILDQAYLSVYREWQAFPMGQISQAKNHIDDFLEKFVRLSVFL